MVNNAFLSREPVFEPEAFVGRQAEIAWAAIQLGGQVPENCNLIGEPRSGKSSLLYYLYDQRVGQPPRAPWLYVWVRLVELPEHTSLTFWRLMLARLRLAAAEIDWTLSEEPAETPRDLFAQLDETITLLLQGGVSRIIFLIDDFDLLQGHIDRHDLNWLRSLATRYRESLAFVIASTDSLATLTNATADASDVSPFAAGFKSLWIGLLIPAEAEALCRQAIEGNDAVDCLTANDLAFLQHEAGRHPALLKIACSYWLLARHEGMDGRRLHQVVTADVRLDDHVRWLCERLLARRNHEERHALTSLAAGHAFPGTPLLWQRLEKHLGLVENRGSEQVLFADAFAYWVDQLSATPLMPTVAVTSPMRLEHLPEQRLVRVDGRDELLTPLENRLLAYLVAHASSVCTTEALLHHVWSPGKSPAVVEKAINRLRAKVEPDPKRPRYILSARGEGYLLRLQST